ncbi:unnamed protein product [Cladocopium goreaui]|uniref:Uncharacterized protein n=1 Tax=Cladocopium goreaui TaxID=2562237 RepID=A0A9P1BL86_9DINO|nr:unnamed protein product [Cladocopium goreaui]
MSLVDSTPVFEARARAIGIDDQVITQMGLRGWVSHATYAFSVATTPGGDEQIFADGVITPLLGNADHRDAPKLRRLFFEAHTLTAAEMKRKVDSTEQEAPRKLPAPEIAQRIELLQARIHPLIVANFLEPSHHLINSLVQCVEDGRVRYFHIFPNTYARSLVMATQESVGYLSIHRNLIQIEEQCLEYQWFPIVGDWNPHLLALKSIAKSLATYHRKSQLVLADDCTIEAIAPGPAPCMFNSGFSQSVEKLSQIVEPPFDDIVSILCLCFKVQKIRDVTFGNCALVIHDHLQNDLKIWKADSSGAIRATNKDPALAAVLNTELDVHHALRRRGVAYEIAQATRAGFRNGPAGELPLDLPAKAILEGPELKWLAKAACGKNTSWRCPWKDFTGCRTQKDQGGAKQEQTRGTPDQKVEKDAYAEEAGRLCALQRADGKEGDEDRLVADSRKRVSAALFEGSGCLEQTLVAKRMRSATDTTEAKEPRSFCDIAEEQSSHTGPAANQEVDGRAGSNATTHSKQLFLLDLFCGTAGVAAAFRAMGGEALGIDHIIDKRRVKGPVAKVDLSKQDGQATVLQWIEEDKVDAVMLAPPCGTASRAREIPLPKRHKLRKGMQPVPLRSEAEPMGLSSLRGVAKIKVLAANKLYAFARKVMDLCERKGLQPRGARAPLLVGDFKFKIDIKSTDVTIPASIEDNVHAPFQGLPLHSKLISSRMVTEVGENGEKKVFSLSSYGVFHSPWEFLDKALTLEHPLDSPHTVDKSNLKAMVFIRDHTKAEVLKFRAQQLRRYTERAAQLSSEENKLKNSLDPDVRRVLEGKRLLLFKEMAADAKVGDENLFTELIEGFKLTGQMPESKQFPARLKPAMISVQQLKDSSVWAKKMIHASCRRVGADPEIARAVYEETLQQRADGWVKGPYTSSELDQKFDGCWIPSKRFGVRQGGKIRAVDDFSEFLVNASVTATEKLQLFGLDEVVNTARTFLGCDFLMMDDELDNLWCSERVRFFTGPWRKIFGRALDLKSAYKQLARHPTDSWAAILAVWNDDAGTVEFYESVALPFGSVCAVMAFNRMAKALRLILSELFMVINTNFFDDFCQLECEGLCDSAWETAEFVMKLLGWRISMSEDKRSPFAGEFNLLGAVVDLTRSTAGLVAVHNKPSRIADLQSLVQSICQSETVALSLLETLKGRPPLIIFTDGACEEDGLCVTHGAAYYDPESHQALMFGDYVPTCWTDKWRTEGKKLDVELQAMHWYTRVPSKSNLSDDPSRLQFSELEAKGFKRGKPPSSLPPRVRLASLRFALWKFKVAVPEGLEALRGWISESFVVEAHNNKRSRQMIIDKMFSDALLPHLEDSFNDTNSEELQDAPPRKFLEQLALMLCILPIDEQTRTFGRVGLHPNDSEETLLLGKWKIPCHEGM